MKTIPSPLTALLLAVLAGCASAPRPLTEDDVRSGIKVTTGDASCPACSRIKTYSSPTVVRASTRFANDRANGWINARMALVETNRTEDHVPSYQLVAEFTNSGSFADAADVYIAGGDKLKPVGGRQRAQCWTNVGSGCSWEQAYAIDASRIEAALNSGGIALFIGKEFDVVVKKNDGYTQRSVVENTRLGMTATIPHEAVAGFVKGLQDRGAEIPTALQEFDHRAARDLAQADRMATAQQKLERERPLKRKVGAQVCRQAGTFVDIGFVEDMTDDKVKIRIADSVLPGNAQVHAGGFHERIIWDTPDNWALCGRN